MKNESGYSASARCEIAIEKYLQLDKNARVPIGMTLHMLSCKKCRRTVKLLALAEKASSSPIKLQTPFTDKTISDVMKNIAPEIPETKLKNPISMRGWIFGGIAMIVFMISLLPILTISSQTKNLLLAFCIVFAGCVTSYCAIFIASNIDFFVKRTDISAM